MSANRPHGMCLATRRMRAVRARLTLAVAASAGTPERLRLACHAPLLVAEALTTGRSSPALRSARRQAVLEHKPKMLFLTSPNNPDGSMMTDEEIRSLLDLPVLVVLDEAYIEFAGALSALPPCVLS